MNFLALDIGGANLKMADGNGFAEAQFFALWKDPARLSQELRTLIAEGPPSDHLLVTMTGELADCFSTKHEGVTFILHALTEAADGRHTRIYRRDGKMVTPQVALRDPLMVAAANWHALAQFAGRYAPQGPAILLDIGSTTCDVVPLLDGEVISQCTTDTARLVAGELIYTGVERSPICAVARNVPYRGGECMIAHEMFATMRDVYLLLGNLVEDAGSDNTADGRGATKGLSRARIGRSICADSDEFNHRDAVAAAQAVAEAQVDLIRQGIGKVHARLPAPATTFILSGLGEFVLRKVVEGLVPAENVVSLARELGPNISRCGPAHALAVIARESFGL